VTPPLSSWPAALPWLCRLTAPRGTHPPPAGGILPPRDAGACDTPVRRAGRAFSGALADRRGPRPCGNSQFRRGWHRGCRERRWRGSWRPSRGRHGGHSDQLRVGVKPTRAGRSCGTLIDRCSGWQALAQHPVVRPVLPAPVARRVPRGRSKGERRRPSRQRLGLADAAPLRGSVPASPKVNQ
jgi:hypothetical protein